MAHQAKQNHSVVVHNHIQINPTQPVQPPAQQESLTFAQFAKEPIVQAALRKYRQAAKLHGNNSRNLDNIGLLYSILWVSLAHAEHVETLCYKAAMYCQDEGIDPTEYFRRLMEAPFRKP